MKARKTPPRSRTAQARAHREALQAEAAMGAIPVEIANEVWILNPGQFATFHGLCRELGVRWQREPGGVTVDREGDDPVIAFIRHELARLSDRQGAMEGLITA
ncbi:MAG: hypothetical protein VKP72_06195 [bacterium]|nr:hypothetical protein [bacterium]